MLILQLAQVVLGNFIGIVANGQVSSYDLVTRA